LIDEYGIPVTQMIADQSPNTTDANSEAISNVQSLA
jgi:hypothetical protein